MVSSVDADNYVSPTFAFWYTLRILSAISAILNSGGQMGEGRFTPTEEGEAREGDGIGNGGKAQVDCSVFPASSNTVQARMTGLSWSHEACLVWLA